MKKKAIFLLMFLYLMLHSLLYAQEVPKNDPVCKGIMNQTVLPFCEALKNGNVNLIKMYISEDLFEKNKVLLEQNKKYPEFLRNYYKGVKFQIGKIVEIDDKMTFNIVIECPNGDCNHSKLQLRKARNSSLQGDKLETWKIVEFGL